ncbi:a518153d-3356-4710-a344-60fe39a3100c [Thermothielavioides terrestris]|uniref:A518153d-3356-4710-a344-60fe39a3100c n=1 Tax=Thermothielavioides terrestris TaxID=2587410 RepID=A0A446BC62_9PEZI|nr:a518153d-3356-4710-a344-60fe39a3100c [Thermothielavioides terrestris]
MPYNTTAIPPRKEVTGQTQLPLTRVKKIIAVDPDITVCSNNAAFEMFVQYLTSEAQNMTKLERKPRRNIQYKDIANAAAHQENLEFLEDVVPKTTTYREIKGKAAAARARVTGEKVPEGAAAADERPSDAMPNGKRAKPTVNGNAPPAAANGLSRSRVLSSDAADPSDQLELEMRQAQRANDDEDVDMAG